MRKSSTWLPINDMTNWDDYSFEQSANWKCSELVSVDTLPCTGDYMMIGRESLSEALINVFGYDYYVQNFYQYEGDTDHLSPVNEGNGNLQSGTFEFMKYKLWAAISGSDYSPCHYGRLEIERALNLAHLSPNVDWPCPVSSDMDGRIAGGLNAKSGTFPFYVAVLWNDTEPIGGTLLSPEHILVDNYPPYSIVAFGLEPGQSYYDALTGPNVRDVVNTTVINDELAILHVSSPIPMGPLVKPAIVTDCSGPSSPTIGKNVAYFGLGHVDPEGTWAETMQVKCGIVLNQTESCQFDEADYGLDESVCINIDTCVGDWVGPIVAKDDDDYYLVAIIHLVENCQGKYLFKFCVSNYKDFL